MNLKNKETMSKELITLNEFENVLDKLLRYDITLKQAHEEVNKIFVSRDINFTDSSLQLKDKEEEIIGNVTSVGFTTPSNHGVLKIELPYCYYKIKKLSKGDKLKLLIV
jgi:hypothetical protein